jgi:hypothetical protein
MLLNSELALDSSRNLIRYLPKGFSIFLVIFFASAFIPGLQKLPEAWMTLTGKTFTWVTGKTPYAFFRERASFPKKLAEKLKDKQEVVFSELGVTFAWDKVCIFGPYTNNEKAMSVTGLTWSIEERSEISFSDSVNALVFLYQGSVNHVVDLKRGIADFKELDLCISRDKARFAAETNANGATVLRLLTETVDQCIWSLPELHFPTMVRCNFIRNLDLKRSVSLRNMPKSVGCASALSGCRKGSVINESPQASPRLREAVIKAIGELGIVR